MHKSACRKNVDTYFFAVRESFALGGAESAGHHLIELVRPVSIMFLGTIRDGPCFLSALRAVYPIRWESVGKGCMSLLGAHPNETADAARWGPPTDLRTPNFDIEQTRARASPRPDPLPRDC